jgi:outer membrane murein-binding lipoprotein Lpp
MSSGRTIAAILGLVLLSGCIAEERSHPVRSDKGGYAGTADQAISDATRDTLRRRVAAQAEGPAKVMVQTEPAVMPMGETAPSGRIAGQKF